MGRIACGRLADARLDLPPGPSRRRGAGERDPRFDGARVARAVEERARTIGRVRADRRDREERAHVRMRRGLARQLVLERERRVVLPDVLDEELEERERGLDASRRLERLAEPRLRRLEVVGVERGAPERDEVVATAAGRAK